MGILVGLEYFGEIEKSKMKDLKKKVVWLSYDLGLKGDYKGMYEWLDSKEAKECGDSLAFFHFSFSENVFTELKAELEENVELKSTDRIYAIAKDADAKFKGKFLKGKRKRSPWEGYAVGDGEIEEDF